MTLLLAATVSAPPLAAANASNTLPRESWRARVPSKDTPPVSIATTLGHYRSAGEAFLALDAYAVSNGPPLDKAQRMFSTGLAEALPGTTIEFDADSDDDGEIDAHLYSEPLNQFGAFPRNCSRGDGAAFPSGGAISLTSGLVYEPAKEPGRVVGPLINSLCERVYCQGVSGCGKQGNILWFHRRAVATFVAQYDPSHGVCDSDRRSVFEDLLGRRSGAQSCEVVGGLNEGANLGGECPALANGSNPVNTVTGNKYQQERDYAGTVHGELRFDRYYNSLLTEHQDIGLGWRHSYHANLSVTTARNGDQSARLTRPDGRELVFNRPAGSAGFSSDPLTVGQFSLIAGSTAYEFIDGNDVRERYDFAVSRRVSRGTVAHLMLASRYDPRSGRHERLRYNNKRLLTEVAGRFGRSLSLVHDSQGRLREITDPAGRRYSFSYDRLGRLLSVTYPDLDDRVDDIASRANNPLRSYRYEDADWPKGLTDIVDESGTVFAHWDYDNRGRALVSEHAGGAQRVLFDYQNAYTAITDAAGQTRTYNTQVEYGVGLISAVSGGDCTVCGAGPLAATSYDSNGHRNLVTDHLGQVTDFDYDATGLELRKREGSGAEQRITSTDWLPTLRLPKTMTMTDGAGHELRRVSYEYWGGMLKQRSDEDLLTGGATRSTRYQFFGEDDTSDPRYGLLKSVDGPRDDVLDISHYDYDPASGNLIQITDALGHITRYTSHDADGRVLTEIDANGVETRYAYDARARLTLRSVAGAETRMQYDARGLLVAAIFPDQSTQSYVYDAAQRLVRVADSSGNAVEYTLDALGNRIGERHLDNEGKQVTGVSRVYNRHNQLEQLLGGAGQTTGYRYDANGRLQTVLDPRGNDLKSSRTYDSLGREQTFTDQSGGVTQVDYDHNDQPLSITDPRGLVTRYRRDGFGNLLGTDSPDAGSSRSEYDLAGNRVRHVYQQKAGVDIVIGYQYDPLNRLRRIDYPTDPDVVYDYDEGDAARHGVGRLTTLSDGSGVIHFHYDARGNVRRRETVSRDGSYALGYDYDAADRPRRVTYASGLVVEFERDAAGRISTMTARRGISETPLTTDIRYHALGGLASLRFGNGLAETRSFDESGRPSAINNSDPRLPSYRYSRYDGADNLLRADGGVVDQGILKSDIRNYDYDATGRLTFEDSSLLATARRYSYDANGNRYDYQQSSLAGTPLRRDQLHVESVSNRVHGANQRADDYDAAGNQRRWVIPINNDPLSAAQALTDLRLIYNEAGRLHRTSLGPTTSITESAYNGLGQRTVRATLTNGRQPTVYLYGEGGELLSAINISRNGVVTYQDYVWLNGRPVAEVVTSPAQATPRINYIHVNHLNQAMYMTGRNGALTWAFKPGDAFGMDAVAVDDPDGDGVHENPVIGGTFPGQVMETPFRSNGFRDYDGRTGRYVESDPIGLAGEINTYMYVGNNPISYVDPLGLDRTRLLNNDGDRNALIHGPTNGNWGGKCWSGGAYSCDGQSGGDAPPTDSADRCYKHHDRCYAECGDFPDPKCVATCDARLVEELEDLPNDPRWWASPPRAGTLIDSRRYRDAATNFFRK